MSWPMVKIYDFCTTGSGGTPSRNNPAFYDGDIPWIKSGELRENIITTASEFITELAVQKSSAKIVPTGSILLAMYGATVGRMAILGIDAATNQAVCNIIPDTKIAFPKYVYYALLNSVPNFLRNAIGGAQPNISQGMIKDTKIPLPPLAEQKRIAAILDKADSLRRKRQQAIQLADQFLRAVFLDMFGDPVTNPRGWKKYAVGELGRVITGSTPPSSKDGMFGEEIPFITPGDLDSNVKQVNRWLSLEGAAHSRTCRSGSLMACCIGATIGKVAMANRKSAFNQQINVVEWLDSVDDVFGYYLFKMNSCFITENAIKTTLPILKKSLFEKIEIPVPPVDLQKTFAKKVHVVWNFIDKQTNSVDYPLFESLSQKAFAGEL